MPHLILFIPVSNECWNTFTNNYRFSKHDNTVGHDPVREFPPVRVPTWTAVAITWSFPGTFSSRSNRNYGNNDRCTTHGTKHRPCWNNCCTRSGNSCRWACRSARPGRERVEDFRFASGRCLSTVSLGLPSGRSPCTVCVFACNCSETLPPSRPERYRTRIWFNYRFADQFSDR